MIRENPLSLDNEDGPLDENFERIVRDQLGLWHVPGVSVAVVDGENTWAKACLISSFCTPILILPLGIWYFLLAVYSCEPINAFLRGKHNQGVYGRYHVFARR